MKGNDRLVNIVLTAARILFGITFVFSGFVKAVDPIGFAYKIEDYLIAFQLIPFIPLALTFAVALILVELLLGVFILLGLYRKLSTAMGVLFMAVMTPMTLYIALKNPVEDCGCFGDALVISNWDTFYKNIVLVLLAVLLLVYHKRIKPLFTNKSKGLVVGFVFLFSLLFCLYNIFYLPIMDFRPYKVGVNIAEQMENDVSNGDVYENIYIYEKDGVEEEFTEDNFPWEDSTWTFVDYQLKLIKEGEKPLIDEFYITAYAKDGAGAFVKGGDITDDILTNKVVLFVVSLSLDDAREKGMKQIIALADYAADNDIELLVATSSEAAAIEQWHREWGNPKVGYGLMDELTLKTIVRSNPGMLLLNEGTIVGKWSSRRLPNQRQLEGMVVKLKAEEKSLPINNNSTASLLIICAIFVIPLLGIKWYERKN
ncbi:MAG TPA: DoxX family protein [Bacteroidales bacterium]|nr:DoxX family protein [Bacteroidales bacterium]